MVRGACSTGASAVPGTLAAGEPGPTAGLAGTALALAGPLLDEPLAVLPREPVDSVRTEASCDTVRPPPDGGLPLLGAPSSCALAVECCLDGLLCKGLLVRSALAALALRLRLRNDAVGLLLPSGQLPRNNSTSGFSMHSFSQFRPKTEKMKVDSRLTCAFHRNGLLTLLLRQTLPAGAQIHE